MVFVMLPPAFFALRSGRGLFQAALPGRPMVYDSVFRVKFRGFRRFYDFFLRRKYLESPVGVIRRFGVRPRATKAKKFPA